MYMPPRQEVPAANGPGQPETRPKLRTRRRSMRMAKQRRRSFDSTSSNENNNNNTNNNSNIGGGPSKGHNTTSHQQQQHQQQQHHHHHQPHSQHRNIKNEERSRPRSPLPRHTPPPTPTPPRSHHSQQSQQAHYYSQQYSNARYPAAAPSPISLVINLGNDLLVSRQEVDDLKRKQKDYQQSCRWSNLARIMVLLSSVAVSLFVSKALGVTYNVPPQVPFFGVPDGGVPQGQVPLQQGGQQQQQGFQSIYSSGVPLQGPDGRWSGCQDESYKRVQKPEGGYTCIKRSSSVSEHCSGHYENQGGKKVWKCCPPGQFFQYDEEIQKGSCCEPHSIYMVDRMHKKGQCCPQGTNYQYNPHIDKGGCCGHGHGFSVDVNTRTGFCCPITHWWDGNTCRLGQNPDQMHQIPPVMHSGDTLEGMLHQQHLQDQQGMHGGNIYADMQHHEHQMNNMAGMARMAGMAGMAGLAGGAMGGISGTMNEQNAGIQGLHQQSNTQGQQPTIKGQYSNTQGEYQSDMNMQGEQQHSVHGQGAQHTQASTHGQGHYANMQGKGQYGNIHDDQEQYGNIHGQEQYGNIHGQEQYSGIPSGSHGQYYQNVYGDQQQYPDRMTGTVDPRRPVRSWCQARKICPTDCNDLGLRYGRCYVLTYPDGSPLNRAANGEYHKGADYIDDIPFRICSTQKNCEYNTKPITRSDGFILRDEKGVPGKDAKGWLYSVGYGAHYNFMPDESLTASSVKVASEVAVGIVPFIGKPSCLGDGCAICLNTMITKSKGVGPVCPVEGNKMPAFGSLINPNMCQRFIFHEVRCDDQPCPSIGAKMPTNNANQGYNTQAQQVQTQANYDKQQQQQQQQPRQPQGGYPSQSQMNYQQPPIQPQVGHY